MSTGSLFEVVILMISSWAALGEISAIEWLVLPWTGAMFSGSMWSTPYAQIVDADRGKIIENVEIISEKDSLLTIIIFQEVIAQWNYVRSVRLEKLIQNL